MYIGQQKMKLDKMLETKGIEYFNREKSVCGTAHQYVLGILQKYG